MAVTLSGTLDSADLARVEATNQGQSISIEAVGGTDYDSTTNLQKSAGGNGYQFLNEVIEVWAASHGQDARSAMLQLKFMLDSMVNQVETTASKVYEP
jgi:hypothetical protein